MTITVAYFIISIGIGCIRAFNTVRGASCVKAGQSVYALGGETYIDNLWQPLKFVYKRKLNSLYFQDPADEGWIRQDIIDYEPRGLYTSAATPPSNSLLHYYRVNNLNLESISLKSIKPPSPRPIVIQPAAQYPRTVKDHTSTSTSLNFNPSSLFVNDLRPAELILLIGESGFNSELNSGSINIFNTKSLTWRSYPAPFLTESFHISTIYQGQVYVFGPGVNIDKLSDDTKLKDKSDTQLILAKFDLSNRTWEGVISVGDIPEFDLNYSYTQQRQYLFLVGKNEGTTAIIYILNLSSLIPQWIQLRQDGFIGYESGCLTYYDDNLYHYFGTNSSDEIQMISTAFWNLESKFSNGDLIITNLDQNKPIESHGLIPIIFGSLGGIFALTLVILLILLLRRRRRNRLLTPKFLQDHVICHPPLHHPYSINLTSTESYTLSPDSLHYDLFEIKELDPQECFNERIIPRYKSSIKPK